MALETASSRRACAGALHHDTTLRKRASERARPARADGQAVVSGGGRSSVAVGQGAGLGDHRPAPRVAATTQRGDEGGKLAGLGQECADVDRLPLALLWFNNLDEVSLRRRRVEPEAVGESPFV